MCIWVISAGKHTTAAAARYRSSVFAARRAQCFFFVTVHEKQQTKTARTPVGKSLPAIVNRQLFIFGFNQTPKDNAAFSRRPPPRYLLDTSTIFVVCFLTIHFRRIRQLCVCVYQDVGGIGGVALYFQKKKKKTTVTGVRPRVQYNIIVLKKKKKRISVLVNVIITRG